MTTGMKITIIGIILILLGCLIFVGSMAPTGFDWSKLSTQKFEQKIYTTEKDFQNICIEEEYGIDIKFIPATDGICRVEYPESKNVTCEISVEGDTLKIKGSDNRRWYQMIEFGFSSPTMMIYLPHREGQTLNIDAATSDIDIPEGLSFENLKIDLSTGDVTVSANVTGSLEIKASTGDIAVSNSTPASVSLTTNTGDITANTIHTTGDFYVKSSTGEQTFRDITCASANLTANTGDVTMINLIASGHLQIETSTGDITLDRSDAATMKITADTGDVTGTLCAPKIVYATSSTGKIEVPHSTEGGMCEIKTSTGNIIISFAE